MYDGCEVAMFMSKNKRGNNEEDNYTYLTSELSALIMAVSYNQEFYNHAKKKAITLPGESITSYA